jgi:DNA-binding CsgD family transcriptional regulator
MKIKIYCAIIGDINKSQALKRRANVQREFSSAVNKINHEFESAIVSKFLVTLGDEFQGLLTSAAQSYDLVRRFEDLMAPVQFAFGIGIGKLSTPIKKEALGMDGEAFYRAREALNEAKHRKRTLYYSYGDLTESLVNSLIALMDVQWMRLTERQKEIAKLLKKYSQVEVARRLQITTQAVSKAKNSGAMTELDEAAKALRYFLAKYKQPK